MTKEAVMVASTLEKNSLGVGVIDLYRIKPLNSSLLLKYITKSHHLITIEENSIVGGLGTIISELLTDNNKRNITLKRIALEDKQCFDYGTKEWLIKYYGMGVKDVVKKILKEKRAWN